MKKFSMLLVSFSLIFALNAGNVFAQKDVILIHGYGNFFDNVTWGSDALSTLYWSYWEANAFQNVNVKHVPWDSKKRVSDQLPYIVNKIKSFIQQGHCQDGCVIYTHSTGGLVADVLLSSAIESKGTNNDYSIIQEKTFAVVEIASAGGGVNLAVYAGDLVNGACNVPLVDVALETIFPFVECGKIESLGAGYDLQPNVARSINGSNNTRTATLMIAGNGNMVGNIVKPFLIGTSDGLVAMHSACGSDRFAAYESCNANLGPEGQVTSFKAPTSFYANHYPYIMTKEGHGSELMPGLVNTDILSTKTETLISNYGYSNIAVEYKTTGWWLWKKYYKNIVNDERHLSKIIGAYFYY
jgi:hypothetical protein